MWILSKTRGALNRLRWFLADRANRRQVRHIDRGFRRRELETPVSGRPVLFFNASTRLHRPSLNAGFSLLASWAVRTAGAPVRYVVCQRGLDPCILGTNRANYGASPPCRPCLRLSRDLFPSEEVLPLTLDLPTAEAVHQQLAGMSLEGLASWGHDGLALGQLCLPGLRWALRRHHLPDDEATRGLFRRYLISAASLANQFRQLLETEQPRALVVFNGIMYPEAVARAAAMRRGIPVVTHEVGLRPLSAFFSHHEATFREVDLPPGQSLSLEESQRLEAYLSERFQGKFTMAGIHFWPNMEGLPSRLQERIGKHRQTVVVFTNVIFDTSQIHANTLYPDMFSWLEDVGRAMAEAPETLFVIRAHPDEDRPGKESRESVAEWVRTNKLLELPNVSFFGPSDFVSSYELIRRAKFVLVYNSSIGLEASILGAPVLCAGRARYTQIPTVFFPATRQEYLDKLRLFLKASAIDVPADFASNARRFLDHELYHASLDLSRFLEAYPEHAGMVRIGAFGVQDIADSTELNQIVGGILHGSPFTVP